MIVQPQRAGFWREVTDPNEIIEKGRWYRVEREGSAFEYLCKSDATRSNWSEDRRVFVDSHLTPQVKPLKVGDTVATEAQLDSLPPQAAVVDSGGDIWQKDDGWLWGCAVGAQEFDSVRLLRHSPFTIILLPNTGEGEQG